VPLQEVSKEARCRQVGRIFQNPDHQFLFNRVYDELVFGAENLAVEKNEILRRLRIYTDAFKLSNIIHKNPNQLSGGQKQLVSIVSCLIQGTEILLMDEVFSQLDCDSKTVLKNTIRSLVEMGKTIIMVEHDRSYYTLADSVFKLEGGKVSEHK